MSKNQAFFSKAEFVKSASKLSESPNHNLPEFAFIGRSNVGKSSLINALVNRKNFARTSKTPGRTQLLNFFSVANKLMIADLPGYGYAKASKSIKENFPHLISEYLLNSNHLKRIFVLIDCRHGFKEIDLDFIEMLDEYGLSYQIILTKCDKIPKKQILQVSESVLAELKNHGAAIEDVIPTSATKKYQIQQIQNLLMSLS